MKEIKKVFGLKDIGMGFTFMLVNLASVVAVTSMMGLSISSALFMTGVNTILFFFLTKGKWFVYHSNSHDYWKVWS